MKVETKESNEVIVLEVSASPAEVSHAFNTAATTYASQMGVMLDPEFPAFTQAEEKLGVDNLEQVLTPYAAEALVPFAIDKSGVFVAYTPSTPDVVLHVGKPATFTLEVTPKAEYELESYEPVRISFPPYEFPEKQVDVMIEQVAEDFAQFIPDDPRPVKAGDAVKIALKAFDNGKEIEQLSTDGRTYLLGVGMLPEQFDKELIGMNTGEKKSFSIPLPTGVDSVSMVQCEVELLEIQKKVVPEITDTWVQENLPAYETAQGLRDGVRERMEIDLRRQYEEAKANAATAEMSKRFTGEIPDKIYEIGRDTLLGNLQTELLQQGTTLEEFIEQSGGEEQFGMSLMMQVRQMLIEGYTLDAVFRHEGLTLTDSDIDATCESMEPVDPQGLRRRMEENGYGFSLREAAMRAKAAQWLADHAEVVNTDENE